MALSDKTSARCAVLTIESETKDGTGSLYSNVVLVTNSDGELLEGASFNSGMAHCAVA